MFGATNRRIRTGKTGIAQFGSRPNEKGPNELRVFEATKSGGKWKVSFVNDTLTTAEKKALGVPANRKAHGSYRVARETFERARKQKKHIVLFVHGYNNDVESVLERSRKLERNYGVIVIPFTWPANGGGDLKGTAAYLSDKRDARASTGALDRVLAKVNQYLEMFLEDTKETLKAKALEKHPHDAERRDALYASLIQKQCPFTINLLMHSMGNYLFKKMLGSSAIEGNKLTFDNVILAAADTNNEDHHEWVDRIKFRNRLYVTINENDFALKAARVKTGSEQLARLGHYPFELNSSRAVYLDVTGATGVGNAHAYFEDGPVRKNTKLKTFFRTTLQGGTAESRLRYVPDRNFHLLN